MQTKKASTQKAVTATENPHEMQMKRYKERQTAGLLLKLSAEEHDEIQRFLEYYTIDTVSEEMLIILINSFASNDSDQLSPLERANQLCLYKSLMQVLKPLFNNKNQF